MICLNRDGEFERSQTYSAAHRIVKRARVTFLAGEVSGSIVGIVIGIQVDDNYFTSYGIIHGIYCLVRGVRSSFPSVCASTST